MGWVLSQILSGTENTEEKGFLVSVPLPYTQHGQMKELYL